MSSGWNRDLIDAIDACIVAAGGTPGARVGAWNQDVLLALAELATSLATAGGWAEVLVTTPVSNSVAATPAVVTGGTFQPAANARYLVEVVGSSYSAASTNGLRWRIADGAATSVSTFSFIGWARDSTTGQSVAAFTGTGTGVPSVASVTGTANPTVAPGAPFLGYAFVETGATPPPVGVYFYPETDGNAVTVYQMLLRYKRVA